MECVGEQIGPFRGGRALAIEGVVGEAGHVLLWSSRGRSLEDDRWRRKLDSAFDKQPISSIGAIAVAPSDHNVIYAGTGEAAIRGNTTYGTGVFKSIDGGKNVGKRRLERYAAKSVR